MANHHTDDDLDELLDSALDDFKDLNLSQRNQEDSGKKKKEEEEEEEEKGLLPSGVQGLGMGLPDMRSKKKKGKERVSKDDHVAEALDKLREQTRETVKGLESISSKQQQPPVASSEDDAMVEDFLKQFEDLAGSTDLESMVETMMQQLLSKDVLHEPMKEIGARYPKWLKENEGSLSKEDYKRYSQQYKLIEELIAVYEREPNNSAKIMEIMQKMQECGQPPNDIVQEMDPGFDFANLGQITPEMLEASPNCCIM